MADTTAAAVDLILARRAWAVWLVARDNDRNDNGEGGDPPVPNDDAASVGGDDDNTTSRIRSGGGTTNGGGGGHHCRNDDNDGYRRGHHRGRYAAGGVGGGGIVGWVIKGVRRLWPAVSIVNIGKGHARGGSLVLTNAGTHM